LFAQSEGGNVSGSEDRLIAASLLSLLVSENAIHLRSQSPRDVPALGEFVFGYEASGFIGIGAPRNTSAQIVETLNKAINTALTDQRMKARLADLGFAPLASSSAEFGKHIVQYTEKWGKVVRAANIKPQ
jgi:tripartite-type tricarboxylate transporter receptor subunit TctC